jgi:molybdate transport system regulatory protein
VGTVSVRFRVDLSGACAIGPGKIALLEGIGRSGSLSQAARDLKMSYRQAWLLLESISVAFREPVVITSIGGSGGGGAKVTAFGHALIAAYRALESDIVQSARTTFVTLARQAVTGNQKAAILRRPLKRRQPPPARKPARARKALSRGRR